MYYVYDVLGRIKTICAGSDWKLTAAAAAHGWTADPLDIPIGKWIVGDMLVVQLYIKPTCGGQWRRNGVMIRAHRWGQTIFSASLVCYLIGLSREYRITYFCTPDYKHVCYTDVRIFKIIYYFIGYVSFLLLLVCLCIFFGIRWKNVYIYIRCIRLSPQPPFTLAYVRMRSTFILFFFS